ncbi:MAG: hypothetical protein LBB89_14075 [Treponema sp.]|jgi:hypothetical protein|nr:hypothetical protein [Treponema sp.]
MEEQIECNNVSKILIKKFPDIITDDLFLDDDETLEYMVASDFARYIIKNIDENNIEKLKECFEFIELLHINGTEKTKELATIGYLEDLQNFTGGSKTMKKYKIIYDFIGIESKKWWDKLNDFWNGIITHKTLMTKKNGVRQHRT